MISDRRHRFRRSMIGAGIFFSALVAFSSPGIAASPLGPARFAAILMDADSKEILFSDQASAIRHPASITKVMTLFLVFDALEAGKLQLTDHVVMSHHAASQRPSKLGLAAGRSLTVDEAIRIVAVKSANDVAVALAEKLGGTEARFAEMMTDKARALGMRQTVFSNASGLPDPATFTSAHDLALLSVALLRDHADRYNYFSERSIAFGQQRMTNHNHLLGNFIGLDGIKTGYTADAGFTLAASAARAGRRLVAVVLGAPTSASRNRNISAMLTAGFTAFDIRALGNVADIPALLASAGFAPNLATPSMRLQKLLPMDEGDEE